MSKKTKALKRHYKKHRKNRTYRTYRKGNKNKRTYKKKINYKTRFKRIDKGTRKGIQIFTEPKKMRSQSISVTPIQSGNMIPGLREM